MSFGYRLRQGFSALFATAAPLDREAASVYLSAPLMALFDRMDRGEQLHSLRVLRSVLARGPAARELAIAALLHDVGKSSFPISVWQKTLAVAVQTLAPARYRHWAQGSPSNHWQRPFVVYVQHPAWGARMLAEAGAPLAACWLVEHHAEPAADWAHHPYGDDLRRLQAADDAN